MNLEPRVNPSIIDAKQWEWMKRYRVWEANRKIFLYPENWLEPELRDDQSPFFKETISELLQSDITEEGAAVTLLNYLSKLEEVAKLEPCGIYYVEGNPDKTEDDIVHVVACTAGVNRQYYYRRREGSWTPWEPIQLDIEDNPVVPVVWKGRLFIFWITIIQKPIDLKDQKGSKFSSKIEGEPFAPESSLTGETMSKIEDKVRKDGEQNTKLTIQVLLCYSELHNGKWQPTKSSDINDPNLLGEDYASSGTESFRRSDLNLAISEKSSGELIIHINDKRSKNKTAFRLYNTHSRPENAPDLPPPEEQVSQKNDALQVNYQGSDHPILTSRASYEHTTVEPLHPVKNKWKPPFFYEGRERVFLVTKSGQSPPINQQRNYGPPPPQKPKQFRPPIIRKPQTLIQTPEDNLGHLIKDKSFGVSNPKILDRTSLEDTLVNKVLTTSGTVRYKNREIGPMGSLKSSIEN